MKTLKQLIFTLFMIVGVVAFTSCSKDDDKDQQEEINNIMNGYIETTNNMKLPSEMASSDNEYAKVATEEFNDHVKSMETFSSAFFIPPNATNASVVDNNNVRTPSNYPVHTYTWESYGIVMTYTIGELSDRYTVTYTIDSEDFKGKIMDGFMMKDESHSEFNYYSDGDIFMTLHWKTEGDMIHSEIFHLSYKSVLDYNTTDYSGTFKTYDSSGLAGEYKWNADGSGSYTDYTETPETVYTWN